MIEFWVFTPYTGFTPKTQKQKQLKNLTGILEEFLIIQQFKREV